MHTINRLGFIDSIREIERRVACNGTRSVVDISHWDPGMAYQEKMLSKLELPYSIDPINYIYGYKIGNEYKRQILLKLGAESSASNCVLMQSSTGVIVNLANMLYHRGIRKLCILQPSYFSVELCLHSFQIETQSINMNVEGGNIIIPEQKILSSGCEAVWITSPVFSVGRYYSRSQLDTIQTFIENKLLVICDEALCEPGREITRTIAPSQYFISFYSPHKTISVNAIKFAAIVCDDTYVDFLEQWSDVFHGGLSSANMMALEHYLSANYTACFEEHKRFTTESYINIHSMLSDAKKIVLLNDTHGQYATFFMPTVPYNTTLSLDFIERLIQHTHTSLLPGHIMGFDEGYGFCFRVNLTLNPNILAKSILTVTEYLLNLNVEKP